MVQLNKKIRLSAAEKNKYVLKYNEDYEILEKCKKLEKAKLIKQDKALVKLIKTQLEDDWRGYLIKDLDGLLKKYRIK